jgi:plasmid stabilization system protein ParE
VRHQLCAGVAGRVPGTREWVLHQNYIAFYRVRGDDVEILRLHHAARNPIKTGSAPEGQKINFRSFLRK